MRISDWSSDVCSSDLIDRVGLLDRRQQCSRRSADQSAFGNLRSSGATGDRRRHRRIAQAQLTSLDMCTRLCTIRLRRAETLHSGVIFLRAYCLARDQPLIPIHVLLGICRCGTSPRERRLDRVQTGTQLPGVDRKQRLSRSNVGTFFVKASLDDTIYTGPHLRCANCLNKPGQLDDVGDILGPDRYDRSEEHTSELQSLMRISYAVFCLKKKKNQQL